MNALARARAVRRARLELMDPERRVMIRVLAAVVAAGATFGVLASLAFPTTRLEVTGTLAIAGASYLVAAVLFLVPHRLPRWAPHVVVGFGTLAITASLYVNQGTVTDDEMFYLWVSLYAFYFFSRGQALAHVALVAAAYAAVLWLAPETPGRDEARWLVTVGSLLVAGLVVGALDGRARGLIRRLREAARTDPLTGLLNRTGFNEAFALELARAGRGGDGFALLVGDLDRFKLINDRLGHQEGDRALERVSAVLNEWARHGDRIARLGGEEFALLAHADSSAEAEALAERLRTRVRELFAHEAVPVTISFGVAVYPHDGEDADALLLAADRALYAAKESGRNRTARAEAVLTPQPA